MRTKVRIPLLLLSLVMGVVNLAAEHPSVFNLVMAAVLFFEAGFLVCTIFVDALEAA